MSKPRSPKESNLNASQEQAIELAKDQGFEVIQGTPNKLLVDIDGSDDYFIEHWPTVRDHLKERGHRARILYQYTSKSGNGTHIVIEVSPPIPSAMQRCLIQVGLGSDRRKEFLSLMRRWDGTKEPSLLFRPRTSAIRTTGKVQVEEEHDDDIPF